MDRHWRQVTLRGSVRPEPLMTLPRSAADVLNDHVVFEIESIDRAYCNLYVPRLQRELGVVGFIREHLGMPVASTAALADKTQAFYAEVRRFAGQQHVPIVEFTKGQRKDDVMREHLARFLAAGRADGVVFIGRAQEKVKVFATSKRRDAEGRSYPWITRASRVVTQWYFYCYDRCAGPFFVKYCGYFPYHAKLQRQRVRQADGGAGRDRLHRAGQRVRCLRRRGRGAADLRFLRRAGDPGTGRPVAGHPAVPVL